MNKIRSRDSAIRLINRVYWPRIVGLAFAASAISAILATQTINAWLWGLLITYGFVWPHIAHVWAKKSKDPLSTESINLFIDALLLGFWLPVISFNFVPSFALLGMHLLSIISVLGFKKALLGFAVECLGILLGILVVGANFKLESDFYSIVVSLPMLFFYPLFVGNNAYQLSLKLTAKKVILQKLSRTDALTGLNNRMYLEEQLELLFKRNKREQTKACFIFIDVDHFKAVNDRHGHIVGDEVLQRVAELIRNCVREVDICGRYGGEEFCILMPNTDKLEAEKLAERIRLHIAQSILHDENKIMGSISLGVAEISEDMLCYSDWLALADEAQYQAKKLGRNQTVVALTV